MRYLYGASVQGIQDFITQTGRLKEMVGASEIVESICTDLFEDVAGIDPDDGNLIRSAAGNIRYVFEDEGACRRTVREFPMKVMDSAPGVRVSQAVIRLEPGTSLAKALGDLERMLQQQRNRIPLPADIGYMGLERSRRTGNVAVGYGDESEPVCSPIRAKMEASGRNRLLIGLTGEEAPVSDHYCKAIDRMVLRDGNRWVAVIHADGNGMGAVIRSLGKAMENETDDVRVRSVFRDFSRTIDACTKRAVQRAFAHAVGESEGKAALQPPYPIRPLVIGGDDLTLVMRADMALGFTCRYLEAFEDETSTAFREFFKTHGLEGFEPGLTACAGIAYVGDSYPFHYGHDMAERLCAEAKRASRKDLKEGERIPSSLSFYKVQDSFVEQDLGSLRERTQRAQGGIRFDYGPYLLRPAEGRPCVSELTDRLEELRRMDLEDDSATLSKLRKWVTEAYRDSASANSLMDRIVQVERDRGGKGMHERLSLKGHERGRSIILDLIQLHAMGK